MSLVAQLELILWLPLAIVGLELAPVGSAFHRRRPA